MSLGCFGKIVALLFKCCLGKGGIKAGGAVRKLF